MSAQPNTAYGTRFRFEGTDVRVYSGAGEPEGVQVGSIGDLYVQADAGSGGTALWHKATGLATSTGWEAVGSSSGGAPADATYIVQTASGSLSAEQALAALATGLLKSTTATGVVSIATPDVDYVGPTSVIDGAVVTTHLVGVTSFL